MKFYKFQAAGNDFILLNFFHSEQNLETEFIKKICHRHFGIGSDGIIVLLKDDKFDFRMKFFNPDGSKATFCGNGGRTLPLFAHMLNLANSKGKFIADDGIHIYEILSPNSVKISMIDINEFYKIDQNFYFINSGTQHTVLFFDEIETLDIVPIAKKIRFDEKFKPQGTNVNFVEIIDSNTLKVRTYEKGVEAETLSCGTGVVASAIAYALKNNLSEINLKILTKGGTLQVQARKQNDLFVNVFLTGAVEFLFSGNWKKLN